MPRKYARSQEPPVRITADLDAKTNRMLEDLIEKWGFQSRSSALRLIIRHAWSCQGFEDDARGS